MKQLSQDQKAIMEIFYALKPEKVIYTKKYRKQLWDKAKERALDLDFQELKQKCPALEHQISKSYETGYNIQPAVFSECIYAQTLANMMNLNIFTNCSNEENWLPNEVNSLLSSLHLNPRYIYSTEDRKKILIQAGGCVGIDSALITVVNLKVYTIEFKEPGAKTSEPDLPGYGEDGILKIDEDWLQQNSQFSAMLSEQKNLNFFEVMGHNVNNFSHESIEKAVSNNYLNDKKYASVICTEDKKGKLVIFPTNHAAFWGRIEGEIRPAGRNYYKVWTPNALKNFLIEKSAEFSGEEVKISKSCLGVRRERGGNRKVSGYKINSIFFVRIEDCTEVNGYILFNINKIKQLKPTIAGKMFFKTILHKEIKEYYNL